MNSIVHFSTLHRFEWSGLYGQHWIVIRPCLMHRLCIFYVLKYRFSDSLRIRHFRIKCHQWWIQRWILIQLLPKPLGEGSGGGPNVCFCLCRMCCVMHSLWWQLIKVVAYSVWCVVSRNWHKTMVSRLELLFEKKNEEIKIEIFKQCKNIKLRINV